jgi:hypothetical protein
MRRQDVLLLPAARPCGLRVRGSSVALTAATPRRVCECASYRTWSSENSIEASALSIALCFCAVPSRLVSSWSGEDT